MFFTNASAALPSLAALLTPTPTPTPPILTSAELARQDAPRLHSERQSPHWISREDRRSPFLRMGKNYDPAHSIAANLAAAGMGREVELWPSLMEGPGGLTVPTKHRHIVLPEGGPKGTPRSVGVVTSRWQPLQMQAFVELFDFLFDDYPPHALFTLAGGAKMGLLLRPEQLPPGRLNEGMELGYCLLNDFTGGGSVSVAPIIMRKVCGNGLIAMVNDKRAGIRVAHTQRGMLDLERRSLLQRELSELPARIVRSYEILAEKKLTPALLDQVLLAVHPNVKKPVPLLGGQNFSFEQVQKATADYEQTLERLSRQRSMVRELYALENDTAPSHLRGTRWLAWQAIAEEADYNHFGGQPKTAAPMFFGTPAKEQEKAFRLLLAK